jgi:hypothetical protein
MSTTKKGKSGNKKPETAEDVKFTADKTAIENELKYIWDAYHSNNVQETIKKNISNAMSKIADIMGMKPAKTNKSPAFKVEVLNAVKEKFKFDDKYYTLAFNYNNINAQESTEKGSKASGIASEKARLLREEKADQEEIAAEKITKEIDKAVGYTKADEEIIKDAVESVLSDAEDSKIGLKQIAESMMSQAMLETKKKETPEQEKKVIKLTESMAQAHVSQVAEKSAPRQLSMSREAEISQVAEKSAPRQLSMSRDAEISQVAEKSVPRQLSMTTEAEISQATTTQTEEPIIERAYVSEQQQMKMDTEEPSTFASQNIFKQVKEGKTKMSDLNNNFSAPIQYPDQLLKWINMIGGWEQYKYNRGKFGLIDDVKGDNEYLEKMKSSLIMVCGDDIGIIDTPVGNINQAVKELMIMKNCYYIYKFKASLPPQYGLIVNANKLMTFADILGKGAKSTEDSTKLDPKLKAQKPVVKGKERIEFEDERKDLIEQSIENRQGATPGPQREFVPKPDINQDTIHKSQVQRGNRGLLQINMDSFNKRTINQGSLAQADAIARGIKIMKPKKQFGRY